MKSTRPSRARTGNVPARAGACGTLVLLAGWLVAFPALAAELPELKLSVGREAAPTLAPEAVAVTSSRFVPTRDDDPRFYRDRLLPKVERQFGRLGHYRWTPAVDPTATEHLLFASDPVLSQEVSDAARKSLERATQRAVEDYLLEETALRVVVAAFETGSGRDAGNGSRGRSFRWGVGISHGLPEVELRTTIGSARVGVELCADGEIGLKYPATRNDRAFVRARIDPERSRYSLLTRLSF